MFYDFTARFGSRILQRLPAEDRASAIYALADLLISRQAYILDANEKDIAQATKDGTSAPLISRLSLTPAKLKSLATGKINYFVNYNIILYCITWPGIGTELRRIGSRTGYFTKIDIPEPKPEANILIVYLVVEPLMELEPLLLRGCQRNHF